MKVIYKLIGFVLLGIAWPLILIVDLIDTALCKLHELEHPKVWRVKK